MDPNQMMVDLILKILENFGWKMIAINQEGEDIRITIQKPKITTTLR